MPRSTEQLQTGIEHANSKYSYNSPLHNKANKYTSSDMVGALLTGMLIGVIIVVFIDSIL